MPAASVPMVAVIEFVYTPGALVPVTVVVTAAEPVTPLVASVLAIHEPGDGGGQVARGNPFVERVIVGGDRQVGFRDTSGCH